MSTPVVSTAVESTAHESHGANSVTGASELEEQEARATTATKAKNRFFIFLFIVFICYCINIRTFFLNSKLKSKILVVLVGLEPTTY